MRAYCSDLQHLQKLTLAIDNERVRALYILCKRSACAKQSGVQGPNAPWNDALHVRRVRCLPRRALDLSMSIDRGDVEGVPFASLFPLRDHHAGTRTECLGGALGPPGFESLHRAYGRVNAWEGKYRSITPAISRLVISVDTSRRLYPRGIKHRSVIASDASRSMRADVCPDWT